jgi:hypothetical protein
MGSARKEGGSKHLSFEKWKRLPGKKTDCYWVINEQFNHEIGTIHWRGGWRQYVFQAAPEIDMSRSCHKEIDAFIDKLMIDWRAKRT